MQRVCSLGRLPQYVKVRWHKGDPSKNDLELNKDNIEAAVRLLKARGSVDTLSAR